MPKTSLTLALAMAAAFLLVAALSGCPGGDRGDSALMGTRPVRLRDLPKQWRSLDTEELQAKLDEQVEACMVNEEWWRNSVDSETGKNIRKLALYLDNKQAAIRALYWVCEQAKADGEYGVAIAYLRKTVIEAEKTGLKEEQAHCNESLSDCLSTLGVYTEAVSAALAGQQLYAELGDLQGQLRLLNQRIMLTYNRLGRHAEALPLFDEYLALIEDGAAGISAVPVLNLKGWVLQSYGRYEESLEAFENALSMAATDAEKYRNLVLLGSTYLEMGRYREAEEYLMRALALFPVPESNTYRAGAYPMLAQLYIEQDRFDKATGLIEDALEEAEKAEGDAAAALKFQILSGLGAIYLDKQEPQQALDVLLQAYQAGDPQRDMFDWPEMLTRLGTAYMQTGDIENALSQFAAVQQHSKDMFGAEEAGSELLRLTGRAYLEQGNHEAAREILDQAYKKTLDGNTGALRIERSKVLQDLGDLAQLQGRPDDALEHYRQSWDILTKEAREFHWNTTLMHGLTGDLRSTGEAYAGVLAAQGRDDDAADILAVCDAADRARKFALDQAPVGEEEAREVIKAYRDATTYLPTLRYVYYASTGFSNTKTEFMEKLEAGMQNSSGWFKQSVVIEMETISQDMHYRIQATEQEAQALLFQLREIAPQAADIIELKPPL